MTELVLPGGTAELIESVPKKARNPSLQLDKLSLGRNQEKQGEAIDAVTRCGGAVDFAGILDESLKRREKWLDRLGAFRFRGKTLGPMTLHLSRSGALENAGIALHPVHGFAWLPGTGIKGMTRAWAETVWAPGEADTDEAWRRIRAVFGTAPGAGKGGFPVEAAAGRIVFHDAWPLKWPRLERDIINNHHEKYYQGTDDPGDWEDPVPIGFLTIAAGTTFDFAIRDRAPADDDLVGLAAEWLRAALRHAGAGAKTAAGYGRIVPDGEVRPPPPDTLVRSEHRLELVSPAFLAGARQEEGDCDLRPATLRGLLRWWWRTMHTGHLARDDLARLEALVWGDTAVGSPVAVTVEPENPRVARQYGKDKIKGDYSLDKPKGKVTQGLFYVSYGMDENSRWYRDAGNTWKLTLTTRAGFDQANKKKRIPAADIMRQAEAALWLLTRFGGVGSKSRKGFGSFADLKIDAIQSIQDCIEEGQRFREAQGFTAKGRTCAPVLEARVGPVEIPTCWREAWCALDRIGAIYQDFAKSLADGRRCALGLPRKVKGRLLETAKNGDRHASPAHWSLSRAKDKTLTVCLIAFPSAMLPDAETSREVLGDLAQHAKTELEREARSGGARAVAPGQPPLNTPDAGLPKPGTRVCAILLEERTKKGKWKAKLTDGDMTGAIFNNGDVPNDAKPGDEVSLFVRTPKITNGFFEWPTPEVEARLAKPAERR